MPEPYIPSPDRYEGQRFLKYIDSWVLWVIDVLDDQSLATLENWEPNFRRAFGMESGTWQDVVMKQMEFTEVTADKLRAMWERQQEKDRAVGIEPNPLAWAHAVSDYWIRPDDEAPP